MKKLYKFCAPIGPGGIKCRCCNRVGAAKAKRAVNRRFRKTAHAAIAAGMKGA